MKDEKLIREDVEIIEDSTIGEACRLLSKYNKDIEKYIAELVAAICNVSKDEMLQDTGDSKNRTARWLYWYAIRYMTNDTYVDIAKRSTNGKVFTGSCVALSNIKMADLISQGGIWSQRWSYIKRIIKMIVENRGMTGELFSHPVTVKIIHPQGVNIELKTE